jgi:undecaprenyl diphosphate synthase
MSDVCIVVPALMRGWQTLEWCYDLGIHTVTVYAFSVENFKRTEEEVTALMRLAETKLGVLVRDSEVLRKHDVAVRILGETDMLPGAVRHAVADAVSASRRHRTNVLNVCMPYTGRHDIVAAMRAVAAGVHSGELLASYV